MPPNSTCLVEEGATFRNFKLIEQGVFQEQKVIDAFMAPGKTEGLSGCRTLKDNMNDLKAQIAANQKGIFLINGLIDEYGLNVVQSYMIYIQVRIWTGNSWVSSGLTSPQEFVSFFSFFSYFHT